MRRQGRGAAVGVVPRAAWRAAGGAAAGPAATLPDVLLLLVGAHASTFVD